MKFDFIIGNPPYQDESVGKKKADESIYNYFMDAAYEISEKVLLITPARFLFNSGNTPTRWNEKMLTDEHFKVITFEQDSREIFPFINIMGGVAIHYRDKTQTFGAIGQFTAFNELNSILKKVLSKHEPSITSIIYNQNKFNLEELYKGFPELKSIISSDGKERRLTSGCVEYDCFHDQRGVGDVGIIGLVGNKRRTVYIHSEYIDNQHENLNFYKVIVPANNGSGAIGEVESTPLIGAPILGKPGIGFTQTFISFGAFENENIANNALKYIKGKFSRTMLGILKVTQNGKKPVWKYVPIQDFSSNSDIDWSKSISEVDMQLYSKYKLSKDEIDFIETHVKEME